VRTDMVAQKDGLSLSMFRASTCAITDPKLNYKHYQGVNLTQEYICTLWLWTPTQMTICRSARWYYLKSIKAVLWDCVKQHTPVHHPLETPYMTQLWMNNKWVTYPVNPQTSTSYYYLCNNQCWVVLCLYRSAKQHLFSLCLSKPVEVVKQRLFCPLLLTHVLEYYIVLPNLYS
jgi:hypothetical protein